jgi:beta-mannosidase
VRIELAAWRDGEAEVASGARTVMLPPRGGLTLPAQALLDHFMDLTYSYRFGPPPCDAVSVTLRSASGDPIVRAFHFPAGFPCEPRGDLGLRAVLGGAGNGIAELTVSTRRLAFGVHFDFPGFEADEEYFHLAPGTERRVVLRGQGGHSAEGGSVHAINATAPVPIEVATCQERRDAV